MNERLDERLSNRLTTEYVLLILSYASKVPVFELIQNPRNIVYQETVSW